MSKKFLDSRGRQVWQNHQKRMKAYSQTHTVIFKTSQASVSQPTQNVLILEASQQALGEPERPGDFV